MLGPNPSALFKRSRHQAIKCVALFLLFCVALLLSLSQVPVVEVLYSETAARRASDRTLSGGSGRALAGGSHLGEPISNKNVGAASVVDKAAYFISILVSFQDAKPRRRLEYDNAIGHVEGAGDESRREPFEAPVFDIVTLAVKPTCVSSRTIASLQHYLNPRRIHVITISGVDCSKFQLGESEQRLQGSSKHGGIGGGSSGGEVRCYSEDDIVPGLTKEIIESLLKEKAGSDPRKHTALLRRLNWYFQQLVKLAVVDSPVLDLPEYFVVWDVDMIPMRPIQLFRRDIRGGWRTVQQMGGLVYPGYKVAYERLLGRPISHAPDGSSFVVHHMVVQKTLMREFLRDVELRSRPKMQSKYREEWPYEGGLKWVWPIVEAVDDRDSTGFSEYWSYASWLVQEHSDTLIFKLQHDFVRLNEKSIHPLNFTMLSEYLGGEDRAEALLGEARSLTVCCPTDEFLEEVVGNVSYVGFEVGHVGDCNYYDPLFKHSYLPEFPYRALGKSKKHLL